VRSANESAEVGPAGALEVEHAGCGVGSWRVARCERMPAPAVRAEDLVSGLQMRVHTRDRLLGSSEIGYSLRVRRVLGAGSRSALPLRFSVVFEYGGLIP
jgi:hypothetical protein